MMTYTRTSLLLALFVASCGFFEQSPPKNLDDACSILRERPDFARAFRESHAKWGIPISVQMATMHQESRFVSDAQTPQEYLLWVIPWGRQSSAYGYAQALDGTWDDYRQAEGGSWARRDDIGDAADFMGWYMHQSARELGISKRDAVSQYLAYHEGRGGYARGSHNKKGWLLNVSRKVGERASRYRRQLGSCGG